MCGVDGMNVTELVVFIIYFVFMVGIGIYFFAKSKGDNEKDYFLGGRQMGPWVSALSAGASDMSAWVLMGLPASGDGFVVAFVLFLIEAISVVLGDLYPRKSRFVGCPYYGYAR